MTKSITLSIFDPSNYSTRALFIKDEDIEMLRLCPVYDVVYFADDRFETKKVVSKFYISVKKNVVEIFKSFDLSDEFYIKEIILSDLDKVETFVTESDSSVVSEVKDDLLILHQL